MDSTGVETMLAWFYDWASPWAERPQMSKISAARPE